MFTADFDYHLPPELIASEPLPDRAASRMLIVDRQRQTVEHRAFADLPGYLQPGDLFVLNNTRVVPARFFSNDGTKELLRVEERCPDIWRCMVKPGKKLRIGNTVVIGSATGTVEEIFENGDRLIRFDQPVDTVAHGHLALPPYMQRQDRADDQERYQTVYAQHPGSIAAPTAGLHFSPALLAQLPHAFVTLHVGVGTFQPVKVDRVEDHIMHHECYDLGADTVQQIRQAQRVIAVGTTVTRVLESVAAQPGGLAAQRGETNIFIYPPYRFHVVDALLTNFHLPKSTLLMLVSALAGRELILHAYEEAIRERYRFFSYGDCMLIL